MYKNAWNTPKRPSTRQSIDEKRSKLEQLTDGFVEVGEGVVPNLYEELLARLEPHGVRRTLFSEDPTAYDVLPGVDPAPGHKRKREEDSVRWEDKREPFYYLCVPCELRLTVVSTHSATELMLQDVHHHVSSADHRRFAAILGDQTIDSTLQRTPTFQSTKDYARIYVNGVPMLVSLRPGGGDLFHHVHGYPGHPAAKHAFTSAEPAFENEPPENPQNAIQHGTLFPRVNSALYWYNPLVSVFTWCRQLPVIKSAYPTLRVATDYTHRIPLAFYMKHSPSFTNQAPLFPVILPLKRGHAADIADNTSLAEGSPVLEAGPPPPPKERDTRLIYVQSEQPLCHLPEWEITSPTACLQGVHRSVVYHEHAYRVVLVSHEQLRKLDLASQVEGGGHVAPILTVQMLKQKGFVGSKDETPSKTASVDSARTFSVSS